MEYARLGKTELEVSRICFGTLWIGGVDEADAIASLDRALEEGINFIDASDGYGGGRSEQIIGKALTGKRDKWVVATKCGLDNGQFKDKIPRGTDNHVNMMGMRSDTTFRNSRPDWLAMALEASLKRLGTDYVDLYQIHYPDSHTRWADTIGAMEKARDQGKVRYWGVSNFDAEQVRGWVEAGALHSLQPLYNMLDREIEGEILPFCREHDIAVLPYSTLAHGLLTGKFSKSSTFGEKDFRVKTKFFAGGSFERNLAVVEKLKGVAADKGVTMAQLAIAWSLAQPGITSALVAAKSPAQVDDNVGAVAVSLGAEDLIRIKDILGEQRG